MNAKEKRKAEPQSARGAPSSIEAHPRWNEVEQFLDVKPGANNALDKALRDLSRAEAESRESGGGPDLGAALRRATFAAEETGRLVQRYPRGIPIPAEVIERRDKAEDEEAAAARALEARKAKLSAIDKKIAEAHARAVVTLHAGFKRRLHDLAVEADCLVTASPEAGRRHPDRLDDRLLDLEREVRIGVDLAMAFSSSVGSAGEADFWAALPEDVAELIAEKWRLGRAQSAIVAVR